MMACEITSKLYQGLAIGLLLGVCPYLLAEAPSPDRRSPTSFDAGQFVLRVRQRINGIMQSVLDLERQILYRMEHRRPIDWERIASRFASARRQIKSLVAVANRMERQISPGQPVLAKIHSLKSEFRGALRRHRDLIAKILPDSGERLSHVISQFESACETTEFIFPIGSFPVRFLDEQF